MGNTQLSPHFHRQVMPKTSTESLYASPMSNSDEDRSMAHDPDRVRRRQLVLSMLGAVSTVTLVPDAAHGVTSSAETDTIDVSVIRQVIKSPLDDRDYRTFTLPNGLRVLLCSDTSTNEAAVAMDVHVGATSDPVDVPGLAHFNEHMLFLGTKKVSPRCFPKISGCLIPLLDAIPRTHSDTYTRRLGLFQLGTTVSARKFF